MSTSPPPPPSSQPTNPTTTTTPDTKSALALSRLPPPFSNSHSFSHSLSHPAPIPTSTPSASPTHLTAPESPSTTPPTPLTFIAQGAEGIVFKTHFLTPATPCMLKYRPPKSYRHPALDRRLTRGRILAEARVLVKGRREGLDVPVLYGLDADAGWILTEWIPGPTIRNFLDVHETLARNSNSTTSSSSSSSSSSTVISDLMHRIGQTVGRMHAAGIVHGDLTTSNMMLRHPDQPIQQTQQTQQTQQQSPSFSTVPLSTASASASAAASASASPTSSIVLIDFGLASQTTQEEDRAVDLYVLERAFGATHPQAETLFGVVLDAYGRAYKGGAVVLRRLADVRARGRKKSMVG